MQTEPARTPDTRSPRADVFLLGVVLIALVVAIGSVVEDAGSLPDDAFAVVNGEALPMAQLDTLLQRLETQLGHVPGSAEREEVIARLVDEELLLQQGLALGLARADTRLRSQLIQDVIGQAVSASAATPVDDAALNDFLQRNAGYFRQPGTFGVERYRFDQEVDAETAARGDQAALARGVRDTALPTTLLTESRWRDYLGSSLAARLVSLPAGGIILWRDASGAASVIRLVNRVEGATPGLDDIRPQVEAEYRRRRDEDALRRYVERLRRDAKIITAEGASG